MKITIEHQGQVIEFTDDHIEPDSVAFGIPLDFAEVPCPDGCGFAHRAFTGGGSLSLSAKLATIPMWRAV